MKRLLAPHHREPTGVLKELYTLQGEELDTLQEGELLKSMKWFWESLQCDDFVWFIRNYIPELKTTM
jgi:hypothetical protein